MEQKELIKKMRDELNDWILSNGLSDKVSVKKVDGYSSQVVLVGIDKGLDYELLSDFENVFGVVCEKIYECKIKNMQNGSEYVKYSYYFIQSGGIF